MSGSERKNLSYLSASSLQDYLDCPRRFQLRYVLEQPWPCVPTERSLARERQAALGRRFHHMVQRHVLGLPAGPDAAPTQQPDLARWWQNYLYHPPAGLPSTLRRAEVTLAAPAPVPASSRGRPAGLLVARLDFVALDPGQRAVIVDWKTGRHKPTRAQLGGRVQTRVYRYVLVAAGAGLNAGSALEPEQVMLVYWFAEFPGEPVMLPYNAMQFGADAAFLSTVISEIVSRLDAVWTSTQDLRHCCCCVYGSLCGHSSATAPAGEGDWLFEPDIEIMPIETD